MIKDISRFKNRDIRRTILLDPKPVNYIMTPENSMPVMEYTAEYASGKGELTDDHLLGLIDELEEIKDVEDVRPALIERFKVR
jgi:TFIIF-interacting CTD phosphatase-like protein